MSTVIAFALLGSAILLNIVATVLLVRSDVPTSPQKALQLLSVWTVPLLGSILVIAPLKETQAVGKRRDGTDGMGAAWLPGIGPESGDGGGPPSWT
jgi:hypothetical protein